MRGRGPVEKKILTGVILSLLTFVSVWAQITSSTVNRVDSVSYPVSPGKDPLFVFYQLNQVPKAGTLSASLPGTALYNFDWSRYNPAISGYDPPFETVVGTEASTVTDLLEGGYRVRIWDGSGTDTTLLAWVMQDRLIAECAKTDEDLVPPGTYTCDLLWVSGYVTPGTFQYYDPGSHDTIVVTADYKFKWTSDNSELRIPNDTIVLDPNITYLPPFEDTWYILTVTDEFGMVDVDSVLYESIQTQARFNVEYLDKVNQEDEEKKWNADLTGSWSADLGSLDARLTVRFNNESKNGESYEWVFLDTLGGIKQGETTYSVDDVVEFTYERADEYYYPYLVSVSEAGCIDTFRLEQPIFVVPSDLRIPNVFSPNGDGTNDIWVFKHQSIKDCKVTIVDRSGKIVYRRKIDDIYSWEGWNGNVHDSERRAPEGQYYFVIEAMGYDFEEYRDPNIIENWRLNRGNNNQTGGTTPPGGQDPEGGAETLYTGWLYLYRNTGEY
jgi:gliding motility-associated-like protein